MAREQDAEAPLLDGQSGTGVEDPSHLEKRDIATPLALVRVQRLQQPRQDQRGAEHRLRIRQRILEGHHHVLHRAAGPRRCPHERVGHRFREAGRHQGGPHRPLLGLPEAEAAPRVGGRDRRRDLVQAEVPAHLFDEVGLAAHVTAPARDLDRHPGLHPEAQPGQDRLCFRLGHVDPQHRPDARGAQGNRALRTRDGHPVDHPRPGRARADLRQQVGDPVEGRHRGLGVGAALEAMRGLGVHSQGPGGAPDRQGLPVGGLEGHHLRLFRDLARRAAHDAGEGQGLLGPGHHAVTGGERPQHAVQGLQLLPLARPADAQPALGYPREVEGVGRVAHLHHHVVREVHHVVDGPHADGFQAVPDPGGRRPQAHVQDAGREPRAKVGGLDPDLEDLRCRRTLLGEAPLERPQGQPVEDRDLAGEAVDVHAVHAVGGDVEVEHRVLAVALQAVQGESREGEVLAQTAGLDRDVDELAKPGEGNLHPRNCSKKRRSFS